MKKIYLLKNLEEGYCKIGVAKNPQKRIQQLQTGNSAKLKILYTYKTDLANKIEKTLHNYLKHFQKEGEWFDLSIKEEQEFLLKCEKIENSIKTLNNYNNPFFLKI